MVALQVVVHLVLACDQVSNPWQPQNLIYLFSYVAILMNQTCLVSCCYKGMLLLAYHILADHFRTNLSSRIAHLEYKVTSGPPDGLQISNTITNIVQTPMAQVVSMLAVVQVFEVAGSNSNSGQTNFFASIVRGG